MKQQDPFQRVEKRAAALRRYYSRKAQLLLKQIPKSSTVEQEEVILPSALWEKLEAPLVVAFGAFIWYVIWRAWQQGLLSQAPYAYFVFAVCTLCLYFFRYSPSLALPLAFSIAWSEFAGASLLEGLAAVFLAVLLFRYANSATGRRHWGTSHLGQWMFGLVASISIWAILSAYDALGSAKLGVNPAVYRKLRAEGNWRNLKVGLALSGGGYRAALLHAGVLEALEQYGVAPTHIASASGGSILGAYYSLGGRPSQFKQAVVDDRFRLKRRLTNLFNLVPIASCPGELPILQVRLLPCDLSRTDVQEGMLHRMVLEQANLDHPPAPDLPRIIIGATDLNAAGGVGITHGAALFLRPAPLDQQYPFQPDHRKRYQPATMEKGAWSGQHLARAVAASGAFPAAFAPIAMEFGKHRLLLADGGMLDNSALSYLLGAALEPEWEMNVILASDGSQVLGKAPVTAIDRLSRAADIVSGGFRSDLIRTTNASIQLLSPVPLLASKCKRDELWDRARKEGRVGADSTHLTAALDVFKEAGTLEDRYSARDADLLYHLGWYLVVLNWPEIRGSLDLAHAAYKP